MYALHFCIKFPPFSPIWFFLKTRFVFQHILVSVSNWLFHVCLFLLLCHVKNVMRCTWKNASLKMKVEPQFHPCCETTEFRWNSFDCSFHKKKVFEWIFPYSLIKNLPTYNRKPKCAVNLMITMKLRKKVACRTVKNAHVLECRFGIYDSLLGATHVIFIHNSLIVVIELGESNNSPWM